MATFTVYKRTNKTGFTWQYDIKDKSFKSGKKRKAGFKTKAEATLAAQQVIRELEDGTLNHEDKKFKDYYNDWLEINGKLELSSKQVYWYERALKLFLEHFGEDILIKNITRSEYQKFITNYSKGHVTETVRKVNNLLKACLRDAVYDGYLKKDPTHKINFKGTKEAKKEQAKYMTIEQYESVLEYLKDKYEKSSLILYILAITGARFSEVNNLKYEDINIKDSTIHLHGTKTENADRVVEISKNDVILINKHLLRHPKRSDDKIFMLSHTAVNKTFKKLKTHIGISDDITPYALRHTHASYLISKQIPIEYISKRLGHANISITLDIYTHLLDEHKKIQGQKVREIFS
ncbi:site-specific integrase [Macrococcoides goetzii]|nr:site-specific integrase [Macrococcus goetzii]TDM39846.1 site-specific integrase [Macrococcus goetzii]